MARVKVGRLSWKMSWSPLGAPLEPPWSPLGPGEDIGGRRTPRPEVVIQCARPQAKTLAVVVRRGQKLSASAPGPGRRLLRPSYAAARSCRPVRLAPGEDIGARRTPRPDVVIPGASPPAKTLEVIVRRRHLLLVLGKREGNLAAEVALAKN